MSDFDPEFGLDKIPKHILDKAREIEEYMQTQGFVSWEIGNVCSRNYADKCKGEIKI